MNKEIAKLLLRPFTGKTFLQYVFEKMYVFSLIGMNYGFAVDKQKWSGENNIFKKINKNLGKKIIFDVGANIGTYSLEALKIFGPTSTIYSFEPSKNTYQLLKKNTKDYLNILPKNIGLSDLKETLSLHKESELSPEASLYNLESVYSNKEIGIIESIKLETIDSFCLDNSIDKIDLLKLDVEGHEYKVLLGAKNMLYNNKIKSIQFEFGRTHIVSRYFFKDFYELLSPKFKIYRLLHNGFREIKQYDILHENFFGMNFYAELKINKFN